MLVTKLAAAALRLVHREFADQFRRLFSGPITLLIWTVMVRSAGTLLGSSIGLSALSQARTVQVIGLAWLLMRVVDFMAQRAGQPGTERSWRIPGAVDAGGQADQVCRLGRRHSLWLDNAGYKVTTLLAGLSISGVAVARHRRRVWKTFSAR